MKHVSIIFRKLSEIHRHFSLRLAFLLTNVARSSLLDHIYINCTHPAVAWISHLVKSSKLWKVYYLWRVIDTKHELLCYKIVTSDYFYQLLPHIRAAGSTVTDCACKPMAEREEKKTRPPALCLFCVLLLGLLVNLAIIKRRSRWLGTQRFKSKNTYKK